MAALIECVPNFSEGRDMHVIKQITDAIESVESVSLLGVDPGESTNRTVVTFVGSPEDVIEAAYRAITVAAQLIDMRHHHGEHPRMGATDVCPLIPLSDITMDETVVFAHRLAQRVGESLRIPVFCYERAAFTPERRNLADIRAGEYEGLAEKLSDPAWQPDFGPAEFNPRSGATVIGARELLVAYNINLNTTSTRRANAVAFDVREKGRVKRAAGLAGDVLSDKDGNPVRIPGSLPSVKAIGWYIEEFRICQVSMNLTDIQAIPLHIAFEEVCEKARARGLRVTGSELVGMVPLKVMLDAGEYFLRKQQRSSGIPEADIIHIAVKSLGLDELTAFNPDEKIIEYALRKQNPEARLVDLTLEGFADAVAAETVTPGGGSVAALVAALGASLGTMVANLSAHKRGWDSRWEFFSDWAVKGRDLQTRALHWVDEDTRAFNALMAAYRLPKQGIEEKQLRDQAIQTATLRAIEVPMQVMRLGLEAYALLDAMAEFGNPNSVSDAGVGALCTTAAVRGAFLNVQINAGSLTDSVERQQLLAEGEAILQAALQKESEILDLVTQTFGANSL